MGNSPFDSASFPASSGVSSRSKSRRMAAAVTLPSSMANREPRHTLGPPPKGMNASGSFTPSARNASNRSGRNALVSSASPPQRCGRRPMTYGEIHIPAPSGMRTRPSPSSPPTPSSAFLTTIITAGYRRIASFMASSRYVNSATSFTVLGSLPPSASHAASTSRLALRSVSGFAASRVNRHATVAAVVSCPATIISVSVRFTSSRVRRAPVSLSRAESSAVSRSCGASFAFPVRAMSASRASARASKCARSRALCVSRLCASGVSNRWYS
mmetsp:Transcript_6746/g.27445  ORF Transcript_6746/g.27445 Transcript_6746/m.27445 type:complete len:271 (-) Transcript_6746:751-1563(-)